MSRPARWLAVLLLAASARAGIEPCTFPAPDCPAGRTTAEQTHTFAFGTTPGACTTCTANPAQPGGPGCVWAQWDTQAPAPITTPFAIPRYTREIGSELSAVEITVRGSACGIVRVEHKDPVNPCTRTVTLEAEVATTVAPGQGLDALGPIGVVIRRQIVIEHQPFDGVIDFAGPSGHTKIIDEQADEYCIRITDPALLAAFVEDGSGPLLFHHFSADYSSLSSCGPATVAMGHFTHLELEVRYRSCIAPNTTFCFGTDATCPCGNGGDADSGCDNAQATGGVRLTATGDPGLNTVVLHGTGFPASTSPTALALRSPSAPSTPLPFGDGLLCLATAGSPARVGAARASGGATAHPLVHAAGAGTFDYQIWYRNEPASFCNPAAAFNSSSAIRIDWP